MKLIHIQTERTTAFTDFVLGLVVVGIFILLYRFQNSAGALKLNIWLFALGLLGFASFLGSIVHGLALSPRVRFWLWQPLNLSLGLVIAMFVTATVFDIWGKEAYQQVLLPLIGTAVVFYAVTLLIPKTFLTFVAYEGLSLLIALAGYSYLGATARLPGAWWMVAGILITIIAAAVQATGKKGTVIFLGMDNNGVFHLIQIFGILALMIGLFMSLS